MTSPSGGPGPWGDPQQWSDPAPGGGARYQPAPQPDPPAAILTAVKLMYVGAALGLLGILVMFLQIDEMRELIEDDNPRLTQGELDTAVNIGVAFGAIVGLVGVGLWIWMAIVNRQGQSWARIVATVLGGLNIGFGVLGLLAGQVMSQPETTLSLMLTLANIGLAAIILALLFQRDSTEYYDAVTRAKLGGGWGYG